MTNMEKGRYVLSGWYENEYGAEPVFVRGADLNDCVRQVTQFDSDFGHTDAELMGGYLVADYNVTQEALLKAIQFCINDAREAGWM